MSIAGAISEKARRATVWLIYGNTDITGDISDILESFSYKDCAEGKSDSISIAIDAAGDEWKGSWMPDKGAKLYPTIAVTDWNFGGADCAVRNLSAECGAFTLDDLSYSDAPDVLNIGAVAKPNDTSFSERERDFGWKNTSVQKIAEEIAGRYNLTLQFEGTDHEIEVKEQSATDSAFLQELCETYGLCMKVYTEKLWIYDREAYKANDPAFTVYRVAPADDPTALCVKRGSFSWNTTLAGTYTGGIFTYTNEKEEIDISVEVGTPERQLKLNKKASNEADAQAQLEAAIANANHGATTVSFTMMGYPAGAAAQCFTLLGYGSIDGKYFIDSMEHSLSKSGYTTKIEASKVEAVTG